MNLDEVYGMQHQSVEDLKDFILKPYLCPAGVPTIGYGATFTKMVRKCLCAINQSRESKPKIY